MRLVSYGPFGAERAGILANEQIFDLEKAMQTAGAEAPVSDMRLFLEQPAWRSALDRAYATRDKVTPVALSTVRLGAPVPVPRSVKWSGLANRCCSPRRRRACAAPTTTSSSHWRPKSSTTRWNSAS